jgi:hypothetical protein
LKGPKKSKKEEELEDTLLFDEFLPLSSEND